MQPGVKHICCIFLILTTMVLSSVIAAWAYPTDPPLPVERLDIPPVIPGIQGFGVRTPAGRGGDIITVTNLDAEGPGSLRAALSTPGPRTIVFEVAGIIDIVKPLVLTEPFVTVAGQTAPSPGITIIGAGLVILTHDVLVQHIRFRIGDRDEGPDPQGRDGISILGSPDGSHESHHVVLDQCSISWAIDENVSTWNPGVRDITIHQCIISECLSHSLHPKGEHSKGLLIGDHTKRIAVLRNLFAHNTDRNPHIKGNVSTLIANNMIYNPGRACIHFSDPEGSGYSVADIIGNHVLPGKDTRPSLLGESRATVFDKYLVPGPNRNFSELPLRIVFFSRDVHAESRVYLYDNQPNTGVSPWDIASGFGEPRDAVQYSIPAYSIDTLDIVPADSLLDTLLSQVGARPADRDDVDKRIIEEVQNRSGRIINTVAEAGGFPTAEPTYHVLNIPARPHDDDSGNGYTNLEEWLHRFSIPLKLSE